MALPEKIEDWNAPWESETGESDVDKGRLKRYLFGLLKDKERLQETVTTVTTERDTLKTAADEKAREGESEVDRLKREKQELEEKLAKAPEESAEVLKLRVALEKGLTAVQAKRLVGNTKEELETDAEELLESFGGSGKSGEEDEGNEPPRRQPKVKRNPGDPDPDEGADVTLAQALDQIPRI